LHAASLIQQQQFRFDFKQVQQLQSKTAKPISLIVTPTGVTKPGSSETWSKFDSQSCADYHVWLQPEGRNIDSYLSHYFRCKDASPHNTSAIILLRKGVKHSFSQQFKHMRLLREYPVGTCVFTDDTHTVRTALTTPLQAWYDAPMLLRTGQLTGEKYELITTGTANCLDFNGAISGVKGRIKIDTGASHNFISSLFVSKAALAVTPCARTVALADGKQVQVVGTCSARLKLGKYADVVHFYVLKLSTDYDAILGEQWLTQRSAVIDFGAGTLALKSSGGTRTLSATSSATMDPTVGGGEHSTPLDINKLTLSALQLKRAVRKGAQLFYAIVKQVEDPTTSTPASNAAELKSTDGLVPQTQLDDLLTRFDNVFAEMPGGRVERPGLQDMTIELEPGKAPPVGVTYRLSQPEYLECERAIKEGLEKVSLSRPLHRLVRQCCSSARRAPQHCACVAIIVH